MEKIIFSPDGESQVAFFVLEQTRLGGFNYILVTDVEDGDGDALILKDLSQESDAEAIYEIVTDDSELSAVATVFENLLEDVDLV
ncbi:MAG: DUF1292 domain-containing protein [Lachnospiraceae bacterium]|nr:DUF1292 domain-containing protein [Lachnospiraceae bacterium]MBR3761642.1 DUF1292 domain-containing protein [Lachnospiraceae bacterium]